MEEFGEITVILQVKEEPQTKSLPSTQVNIKLGLVPCSNINSGVVSDVKDIALAILNKLTIKNSKKIYLTRICTIFSAVAAGLPPCPYQDKAFASREFQSEIPALQFLKTLFHHPLKL